VRIIFRVMVLIVLTWPVTSMEKNSDVRCPNRVGYKSGEESFYSLPRISVHSCSVWRQRNKEQVSGIHRSHLLIVIISYTVVTVWEKKCPTDPAKHNDVLLPCSSTPHHRLE
jgi:hypothetical protein